MTPKELLNMPLYRDTTLRDIFHMYALEDQFDQDDLWPEGCDDIESPLYEALAQKLIDLIKKD